MNSIASSYVSRRIGRNATYGGRWVEVWILRAVRGEWMASSGRWQKTVVFGSTKRGAARESILGGSILAEPILEESILEERILEESILEKSGLIQNKNTALK